MNCRKLLEELQQCRTLNEELTKVNAAYKANNSDRKRKQYERTINSLKTKHSLALLSQERERLGFLTVMIGRFDSLAAKRAVMWDTIRDIHDLTGDDVQFDQ